MNPRLAIGLVLLGTAVAAGCGTAAQGTTPAPAGSHTTTTTAAATPSSALSASLSRCRTSQLHVSMASNGAAGSVRLTLAFTNTGSTECFLYGYPGLGLRDGSGTELPTQVLRTPSVVVPEIPERRVVLAPGGKARAYAGYSDVDPQPCRSATALEVTPPDAYSYRILAARIAPCGGIFHVSPVFK
jgi:hypothetical protein